MSDFGNTNIHFKSSKKAILFSIDKSCWAGERTKSGRIKTWIASVAKNSPYETRQEIYKRLNNVSSK